jgi:hypothetical protein
LLTATLKRKRVKLLQELPSVKVIRAGVDAWKAITKTESFDGWLAIGRALQIGRDYALRTSGANSAMGRLYCREFSIWIEGHGFRGMKKSVRSVAIELAENSAAITAWRDSLPERQRRRLIHPLSVTRRWRMATQVQTKTLSRTHDAAKAAWKRFVACVESLPPDQAMPLWQAVHHEAAMRVAT